MKQHYNLSDQSYNELLENNVSNGDLLTCIPLFTPFGATKSLVDFEAASVTKVSLMYYVDWKGDFTQSNNKSIPTHQKIAKAVFKSLELDEQMEVLEYISYMTDDEDETA